MHAQVSGSEDALGHLVQRYFTGPTFGGTGFRCSAFCGYRGSLSLRCLQATKQACCTAASVRQTKLAGEA
jgi:hypothetical protein